MKIEFDPAKDAANIAKHGISLADAINLDFEAAQVRVNIRSDYGETRYRAFGRIENRGYCPVFTIRGDVIRPISFRRAWEKEMRRHGR